MVRNLGALVLIGFIAFGSLGQVQAQSQEGWTPILAECDVAEDALERVTRISEVVYDHGAADTIRDVASPVPATEASIDVQAVNGVLSVSVNGDPWIIDEVMVGAPPLPELDPSQMAAIQATLDNFNGCWNANNVVGLYQSYTDAWLARFFARYASPANFIPQEEVLSLITADRGPLDRAALLSQTEAVIGWSAGNLGLVLVNDGLDESGFLAQAEFDYAPQSLIVVAFTDDGVLIEERILLQGVELSEATPVATP